MGVLIRIPGPLRRLTNGKDRVELEAENLRGCLEILDAQFPGFQERIVNEDEGLREFVNVFLNGEDVRFLQVLDTPTKSGDEISIVPAVACGHR